MASVWPLVSAVFIALAPVVKGRSTATVGILARSEMILPTSSPCPWDYEVCIAGAADCIGPSKWGLICDKAYDKCGNGLRQSPIDIDVPALLAQKYTPSGTPLRMDYTASEATLKNTGRGVEVEGSLGSLFCGEMDREYQAVAVHFHSPSEHTRQGEHLPLEVQVVHQRKGTSDASDLVVTSFLFAEGPENTPNAFLRSLGDKIPAIDENAGVEVDLNLLGGLRGSYIRYEGSITTPPCLETVRYMVMSQIQPATNEQLQAYKEALGPRGNSRPTQPIAGRQVEFYDVSQYLLASWKPSLNFTISEADAAESAPVAPEIIGE